MTRIRSNAGTLIDKSSLLTWGLAAFPFLLLIVMLRRYSLDAPYLDQWEFAVLLGKSYEGGLAFQDFWGLHNEHRPLFPRLLLLLLARLSHWNILWELAACLALGVAIFFATLHVWRRVSVRSGPEIERWVVPLLSLLAFSTAQWQNWSFGWQVQEFMQVLAVILGLILLHSDNPGAGRIGAAAGLGIIATFSFASGLVFWPIGCFMLFTQRSVPRTRRITVCQTATNCGLAWTLISLVVACAYLFRFHTIDYHPGPWRPAEVTTQYLHYVSSFLGGPLISYSPLASMLAGVIGLAILSILLLCVVRSSDAPWRDVSLPVALAAFSMGTAAMTGFGRVAFGAEQAMSSRYITLANPFWMAVIMLAGILAYRTPGAVWRPATALLALLLVCNAAYGANKWIERYRFLEPARAELISGNDPALLQRLHPNPGLVLERREILKRNSLSVFRE